MSPLITVDGDYLSITLEGMAQIDASKIYFAELGRSGAPKQPPVERWIIFVKIVNRSTRTWEWQSEDWRISDGTVETSPSRRWLHRLSELGGNWKIASFDIDPEESVKTVFMPPDSIEVDGGITLSYEKMLAEAWYDDIRQDDSIDITDFTREFENINIQLGEEAIEGLLWENQNEYA